MAELTTFLLELCCEYLSISDLANLACTSRQLNDWVTPRLYHTIHFHSRGRIAFEDPIFRKLDIFGDPRFSRLQHTSRLYITGSWYHTYKEIESELGQQGLFSPAARMFSNIISSCVVRMPLLKEFIWDMQISPTQFLVTSVMFQPNLETLQLRMSTDHTPKPYFHPLFEFHTPINVKIMRFLQVDKISVLRTIGLAVSNAANLKELSIWADEDMELTLDSLFDSWQSTFTYNLTSLDIRGFRGLGAAAAQSLWDRISPSNLRELTLQLVGDLRLPDGNEFWEESFKAGLRPLHLSSNLVNPGLTQFIASFSGLRTFNILPSNNPPAELLLLVLQALQTQHSATLKVLAICPQGLGTEYTLNNNIVSRISTGFPEIEELRFGLSQLSTETVYAALCCPKLKVLHILHLNPPRTRSKLVLRNSILKTLNENLASTFRYLVFDDDPICKILRKAYSQAQAEYFVGYVANTVLLSERMFGWMEKA